MEELFEMLNEDRCILLDALNAESAKRAEMNKQFIFGGVMQLAVYDKYIDEIGCRLDEIYAERLKAVRKKRENMMKEE